MKWGIDTYTKHDNDVYLSLLVKLFRYNEICEQNFVNDPHCVVLASSFSLTTWRCQTYRCGNLTGR